MNSRTTAVQNIDPLDRKIIERYLEQPAVMPDLVRERLRLEWITQPVQLYALADLDASMQLCDQWLILGEEQLALIRLNNQGDIDRVDLIPRERIQAIREEPGLSCTRLVLLAEPGDPALAVLRYTHRQRRAMENIKFVLQQQIDGYAVDTDSADAVYASATAHAVRSAQASVSGNRLAVLWRLLSYLRPYRTRLLFGLVAVAVMTALMLVPPYLVRYLVDDVFKPLELGVLNRDAAMHTAGWVIFVLALSYLLREAAMWVRLRTMSLLGEQVARDLRKELYAHLQQLSLSFYSRKQTGSIISRVSHDTDRLWDFIAVGVVEVSLSIIMLIGLSIVLLSLDWRLGLLMTLPVPLLLWSFVVHSKTMKRLFLRAWRKWSGLTEVLSDTVPGMRVVKAFAQEKRETTRFNTQNDACMGEFNGIHVVWTRFWPRLMLGLHAMTLSVWVFALPRLVDTPGEAPLTIGTFMAFLLYMGMFFQPIETIGMMTRMMNRATSSALRIFEILDTEPEMQDVKTAVQLDPVSGHIAFDNVSFAYDGVRQVLKSVSFEVQPGEMIGLVGPSGAGKSTITNLIARFYEVTGGCVSIDGEDIRNLDTGHYRRQLGMVLQDPHLFHGTVLDNIRYGAPEASLVEVIAAARAANVHDFVCKLAQGYDTMVGERGHTLSGGERQRISIARAILNNPRILILDEATSSVDTETEHKIQEALNRLIAGRTVIAVAHRLSTLRRASRLLVLKDGRLVETGSHEELLENEQGVYRKLFDMQHALHDARAI